MSKRTGSEPSLSTGDPSNAPMLSKARIAEQRVAIRERVLERAGNCCEECQVVNGAIGARTTEGEWYDEDNIHTMNSTLGYELFGEFPIMIKIVLVCIRPDLGKAPSEDNLRALCQRCALNFHRAENLRKIAETRRRKRLEALHRHAQEIGQTEMEGF